MIKTTKKKESVAKFLVCQYIHNLNDISEVLIYFMSNAPKAFMSWCLNFLCCWRLMYVFIFLVKLR